MIDGIEKMFLSRIKMNAIKAHKALKSGKEGCVEEVLRCLDSIQISLNNINRLSNLRKGKND